MIRILLTLFAYGNLSLISATEPQQPNVVIIYTDDQGYGDVSSMNADAKFQTPNYDRLAREGISFTNAHSSDTVCTPSRYGLLTGRYAWRTRLKKGVMGSEGKCLISDDTLTVPSFLKSQGYTTAMVGKWHLGMTFDGKRGQRDWSVPIKDMPLDKGFDYYFGIPASLNYGILAWFEGRHAAVPPTLFTAKKPNKRHIDYRIKPPYQDSAAETKQVLKKEGIEVAEDFIDNQCLTRFTDQAISWMGGHLKSGTSQGKTANPFFLYLPLTSPHYPVCPLPEFQGKGDCGGYGEFVIETDHRIGQVLDFLDQQGIADNTIVIVTSDNGPEGSWKRRIEDFDHASNAGFRGGKRDIYEGGHRVPFLVRWPKGISNPGRTSDRLTGQTDIFATLADVLGESVPGDAAVDSCSFAKVLTDDQNLEDRAPLINHGVSGRFAVTKGDWKLVMPHRTAKTELYHLKNDPSESTNLHGQNSQIENQLQSILTGIVCRGRTTTGPVQSNDTGYWDDLTWITEAEYQQVYQGENNK
ncbi:MAG: arylsulfatase [Fuerstiella sp.]